MEAGYEQLEFFDQLCLALFQKRTKFGHSYKLQWKTNRNSYAIYRMVPFSINLSDPKPKFQVTPIFDVEYGINGTR